MGILTCSFVAWFVLSQVPPSDPPPPSALTSRQNEQNHAPSERDQADSDNPPPGNQPAALRQGNTEPSDRPQRDEGGPQDRPSSNMGASFWNWLQRDINNSLMVIFNGILAVVTVLQWRILSIQIRTTRQELRAYVFLDYPTTRYAQR